MRREWMILGLGLWALGCAEPFNSETLGVTYEPPRDAGRVQWQKDNRLAVFPGGVELELVLADNPISPSKTEPWEILEAARRAGASGLEGTTDSVQFGTVGLGPCTRVQLTQGTHRTLAYITRHPRGYLVARAVGAGAEFHARSNAFERSLGSLRWR